VELIFFLEDLFFNEIQLEVFVNIVALVFLFWDKDSAVESR